MIAGYPRPECVSEVGARLDNAGRRAALLRCPAARSLAGMRRHMGIVDLATCESQIQEADFRIAWWCRAGVSDLLGSHGRPGQAVPCRPAPARPHRRSGPGRSGRAGPLLRLPSRQPSGAEVMDQIVQPKSAEPVVRLGPYRHRGSATSSAYAGEGPGGDVSNVDHLPWKPSPGTGSASDPMFSSLQPPGIL
jgi:hypothetical protein